MPATAPSWLSLPTKMASPAGDTPDAARQALHEALCLVLIGGNLTFGTFAQVFPGLAGKLAAEEEGAARAIGARDFRLGVDLLQARQPLPALVDGIVTDVGECAAWLRKKPLQALVPGAWAVLGLAAALTAKGE